MTDFLKVMLALFIIGILFIVVLMFFGINPFELFRGNAWWIHAEPPMHL